MSTKNTSIDPSPGSSWLLRVARVVLLSLLLGALPLVARAAVDLVSLEAFPEEDAIHVTWETASEIDMVGFYVQRAPQANGSYDRISDVIFAEGGMMGGTYEYVDADVAPGDTLYYRLEALEVTGFIQLFGPISATLPLPPTPTPTLTPPFYDPGYSPLPTNTPLPPTATQPPLTVTPTPTPRPTRVRRTPTPTPTPRAATATPVFTFRTPTPTATRPPALPTLTPVPATSSPTPTLTPLVIATRPPSATPSDPLRMAEAGTQDPTASPTQPVVKDGGSGVPRWLAIPGVGLAFLGLLLVVGLIRWWLGRRV